jgi:hypothetical protein
MPVHGVIGPERHCSTDAARAALHDSMETIVDIMQKLG